MEEILVHQVQLLNQIHIIIIVTCTTTIITMAIITIFLCTLLLLLCLIQLHNLLTNLQLPLAADIDFQENQEARVIWPQLLHLLMLQSILLHQKLFWGTLLGLQVLHNIYLLLVCMKIHLFQLQT